MHFSVFLVGRSEGPGEDAFVMNALAEHALEAEELGFDAVFLPDHHFTGYAPMSSDPLMYAAYLAGRMKTDRMHFGTSVTTMPLHHPLRFVERVNLLDQITHGKVLIGIGSGTTPEEMIGLGVNFKDASRISEKNFEIAMSLWDKQPEDPPVLFENEPYKGALVQRIVPTTYSARRPRIMTVAIKEASMRRAAERAWPAFIPAISPPVLTGLEPFKHVSNHFGKYLQALQSYGHSEAAIGEALAWTTHTYQCVHVAPTDSQARAELEWILERYQAAIEREHKFNKDAERLSGIDLPDPPNALTEEWIATWCAYGSPETVAAKLAPYKELGIGNVLMGFTNGPLTAERLRLTQSSMRLFASEVAPRLRSVKALATA